MPHQPWSTIAAHSAVVEAAAGVDRRAHDLRGDDRAVEQVGGRVAQRLLVGGELEVHGDVRRI